MSKEQFLKELQRAISKLPKDEQDEIVQDYKEYFEIGELEGKTEKEMTSSLGQPKNIGKELVATYQIEKVEKDTTIGNFIKATWLVIGLGFFNLVIVLGPFLVLAAVILSAWVLGISLISSPLLVLINVAIYPEIFALYDLFTALLLCGVGLFVALGSYKITKICMNGFTRYLKYNTKVVKRGMAHA